MTANEIQFLELVRRRQTTGDPVSPLMPVRPGIQSLIDRGYLKLTRLVIPALNCYSDDHGLKVTEAGEAALQLTRQLA
jgi:hypothetical protein